METEKKRRAARKEARERAVQLMKEGRGNEAKEYFQRWVDITPEMAQDVIRAARDRNVDCIVAPYEADAQLAYLATSGIADFVVTEDSDLTLFGCERVLFKLIDSGDCVLYEKEHLNKVFGLQADLLSFEKFRYMCITAGCDYLTNLPGIGLGKAKNFWLTVTDPDLRNVLRKIPAHLKMPQVSVTQDYIERFIRANNTFLYQLVFDPVTRKEKPLTPYPADLKEEIETLTYAGSYSPPEIAAQMALGNMNIRSQKQVDHFDPDRTESTLGASNANTKYGKRAFHRSMWCRDLIEKGPATSATDFSLNDKIRFNIEDHLRPEEEVGLRTSTSSGVDMQWLEDTVRKHYGDESPLGLSVPEFMETLLTLLSSDKSAEDLQTEMFYLCGFERFDMIGALLENRPALLRSLPPLAESSAIVERRKKSIGSSPKQFKRLKKSDEEVNRIVNLVDRL